MLYDQRRYALAEKEVGQALLAEPNDARSLALLALCLLEQEKFTEATQRAQEAVANSPDESFSHYTLARVWIERNYLDRAEPEIQAALAIDPHLPHYHVTLLSTLHLGAGISGRRKRVVAETRSRRRRQPADRSPPQAGPQGCGARTPARTARP
jgi:tetratricopeptide (TPR) repeat protein